MTVREAPFANGITFSYNTASINPTRGAFTGLDLCFTTS